MGWWANLNWCIDMQDASSTSLWMQQLLVFQFGLFIYFSLKRSSLAPVAKVVGLLVTLLNVWGTWNSKDKQTHTVPRDRNDLFLITWQKESKFQKRCLDSVPPTIRLAPRFPANLRVPVGTLWKGWIFMIHPLCCNPCSSIKKKRLEMFYAMTAW